MHPSTDLERFEKDFELKFKTGKRGQKTANWVVEVYPTMRNRMRNKGRLFIGHGSS